MESIKKFVFNSTTSSLKERNLLFTSLFEVLRKKDKEEEIPDVTYKALGKSIYFLFPIYLDHQSRRNLIELNDLLVELNVDQSLKAIITSLESHSKSFVVSGPNQNMSLLSLNGLEILNRLLLSIQKFHPQLIDSDSDELAQIIQIYSDFILAACSNLKQKNFSNSYKKFLFIISKISGFENKFKKALMKHAESNSESSNMLLSLGFLLQYYHETKSSDFNDLKEKMSEMYAKRLIGSKSKPRLWLVKCSNYWLKYATKEEFEKINSAIQRSLLRNPEFALEAIGTMLDDLTIDLSEFGKDLIAVLGNQLLSKDENMQNEAVFAIKALAKQCSTKESVIALLKQLFTLLKGEAKSSMATKKALLQTIENCSANCSQEKQELALQLIDSFSEFFKMETHEGTLLLAFQALTTWFNKLRLFSLQPELVKKLNDFFKTLVENKSYSSTVRSYVFQLITTVYADQANNLDLYLTHCTNVIEKAYGSQVQNQLLVAEALSASILLATYYTNNITHDKLAAFASMLNDAKKQMFTNEKFLCSMNELSLRNFSLLFEKLVHINSLREVLDLNAYYAGFVFCLLHPNYAVRSFAQERLRKILKWCPSVYIINFLKNINATLSQSSMEKYDVKNSTDGSLDFSNWPSSKGLCECLPILVNVQNLSISEVESIVLECALIANSKLARQFDKSLFEKCIAIILKENEKDIKELTISQFLSNLSDRFLSSVTQGETLHENQLNAISTLAHLDSNFLTKTFEYALSIWEKNATSLLSVTKEEFEIMRVKEGELHDKSLVESFLKQLQDSSSSAANLRRENKAYSYKEQLAEIELRKELDAKKASAHKNKTYTLDELRTMMSKKQQETLDAQIQREARIRSEMNNLCGLVNKSNQILTKLIEGNPSGMKLNVALLVKVLAKFIKSPMCAPFVLNLFRTIVLSKMQVRCGKEQFNNLNEAVVNCTFRLANAPVELESGWLQEPLESAYQRLIRKVELHIQSDIDTGQFDLFISSIYFVFFKYAVAQASIDETCLKYIIGIIAKFGEYRSETLNKVQIIFENESLGGIVSTEDSLDDELNRANIDNICKNFMSNEYLSLLMNMIVLASDKKLNLNVQYQACEVCKNLVAFSARCVFSDQCQLIRDFHDGFAEYTAQNYRDEVTELISTMTSSTLCVREAALGCLLILVEARLKNSSKQDQTTLYLDTSTYQNLIHKLTIALFDVEESAKQLAEKVWTQGQFKTSSELCLLLVNDVVHPLESVRLAASAALAHLIKEKHGEKVHEVMKNLLAQYDTLNRLAEPKKDQFGRVIAEPVDEWEARTGIAFALTYLAQCVPGNDQSILPLFSFFVHQALNDRNQIVQNKMLEAAIECLNYHGKSSIHILLPLFENFLQDTPKVAAYDSVRQNVVILMGTLAKHLDKDDERVAPIIGKLIQSLQTPSQQVQEAVANCLPPLMASIKTQVPTYVDQLINLLLTAPTYGERRGAAYGLAGMLKGIGMLSLRQLNVLQRLNDAVNNKKDAKQREGALLAYEMLTVMFNKVFEPYSVEVLPNLLLCFGDADPNVRQAADDCAKAIMKNLTFTGVKMILPKLLERLGEDESWRTKCGSVELLGAMAHCAPKQLSTCLPNIVPKLIEVLSDSHIKVQKAGTQALRQIGSVIKNPEILMISDTLLEGLQDPAMKTQRALQVLLETKFVHFIDAPSLALIMPVVQRAFQDRSTEIRKMAAQIMGNMYSLTDQKDLLPYLPSILPGLKQSLLDPVPEVRSVSSKALGSMIKAIGENGLNEIISWLMEKLVSEVSSVDRSGAAQGLSEVFGALGVNKLEKSMPEIIERAAQLDLSPFVRDGYIMMFIYLPLTFGDAFIPYVGLIIQPILKALADDSEFVRDTAIKAGQRIVNTYADTAISLFLPELEKGLFDSNWRIRFSSVQLLGDLLYKISGVVGKMTTESAHEDDNFGTEKGSAAIVRALGEERRNRVYSGLYMGRSDTSLHVRQAALHVWKVIVSNTPKTLKEILPTLFNLLLGCLADSNSDKRQIGASTLVDIVKKLGERVLPEIIPILEYGLNSNKSEQRQGVCIGLTEIMANTSKDNVIAFSDSLIPTVRKALSDPSPDVRFYAAKTFDSLHNMIGAKALDEVALYLYDEAKKTQSEHREIAERALDGLKQIMIVKSRAVLPFLIPHLTQPPVNINALCKLCCCASVEVLSRHLGKLLSTLVVALSTANTSSATRKSDEENHSWLNDCESLILSIEDDEGVRTIIHELLHHATTNEQESLKCAALDMLFLFCSKTEADYSEYLDDLTKSLISLLADKNDSVLNKAWDCLNCIINSLKGNMLLQRLPCIRQSIRLINQFYLYEPNQFYNSDFNIHTKKHLAGFCLPKKGISCLLPVFKEGLLNGPPDIKEQSAQILCECMKLSDGDSLKSSVMTITGPLIRVLGERYSWNVKSVVLDALYLLLLKVEVILKPFLPQLQPTFLKNLNDVNRTVRLKAGCALAKLLFMNPKLDQVILEIYNYIKSNDDLQIRETLLYTLRLCLNNVGAKLQEETKNQIFALLIGETYIYNQEYAIRAVSAGCMGALAVHINEKQFEELVNNIIDYEKCANLGWRYPQASCMIFSIVLKFAPQRMLAKCSDKKFTTFVASCMNTDRIPVCLSALRSLCNYINYQIKNNIKVENDVANMMAKCINHSSTEVKLLAVQSVNFFSCTNEKTLDANLLKLFIPMLVNGTREKASQVRLGSEIALVNLLHLNKSNSIYNESLELVVTMKESFADCVKSLSKESMSMNVNLEEYQLDETILKVE